MLTRFFFLALIYSPIFGLHAQSQTFSFTVGSAVYSFELPDTFLSTSEGYPEGMYTLCWNPDLEMLTLQHGYSVNLPILNDSSYLVEEVVAK